MIKRALDLLVSMAGLLALCPLMLLIAAVVKADSPGPVLFRQRRVGRGMREFHILKFRTMADGAHLRGSPVTAAQDPRVTRSGRLLRRLKLDELPQLWNVLVGDMSLVGPRPEVPRYVEMFREDYAQILTVRPGITDPASLLYRDEEELLRGARDPEAEYVRRILPRKLAISKAYARDASLAGDLGLILRSSLLLLGLRRSGRLP